MSEKKKDQKKRITKHGVRPRSQRRSLKPKKVKKEKKRKLILKEECGEDFLEEKILLHPYLNPLEQTRLKRKQREVPDWLIVNRSRLVVEVAATGKKKLYKKRLEGIFSRMVSEKTKKMLRSQWKTYRDRFDETGSEFDHRSDSYQDYDSYSYSDTSESYSDHEKEIPNKEPKPEPKSKQEKITANKSQKTNKIQQKEKQQHQEEEEEQQSQKAPKKILKEENKKVQEKPKPKPVTKKEEKPKPIPNKKKTKPKPIPKRKDVTIPPKPKTLTKPKIVEKKTKQEKTQEPEKKKNKEKPKAKQEKPAEKPKPKPVTKKEPKQKPIPNKKKTKPKPIPKRKVVSTSPKVPATIPKRKVISNKTKPETKKEPEEKPEPKPVTKKESKEEKPKPVTKKEEKPKPIRKRKVVSTTSKVPATIPKRKVISKKPKPETKKEPEEKPKPKPKPVTKKESKEEKPKEPEMKKKEEKPKPIPKRKVVSTTSKVPAIIPKRKVISKKPQPETNKEPEEKPEPKPVTKKESKEKPKPVTKKEPKPETKAEKTKKSVNSRISFWEQSNDNNETPRKETPKPKSLENLIEHDKKSVIKKETQPKTLQKINKEQKKEIKNKEPKIKEEPKKKIETKKQIKPEPKPKTFTKPEPKPEIKEIQKKEPKPTLKPAKQIEPKKQIKPEPKPKTFTKPEPKPEIEIKEPKPIKKPAKKIEPKKQIKPELKPKTFTKPEPKPEIKEIQKKEPKPTLKPKKQIEPKKKIEPKKQIKPEPKPKTFTKPEPKPEIEIKEKEIQQQEPKININKNQKEEKPKIKASDKKHETFKNKKERENYFQEMQNSFKLSFQQTLQKKKEPTTEPKAPKKLTHIKRPKRRNIRQRTNLKTDHLNLVDPKKAAGAKPKNNEQEKTENGIPIGEIRNLRSRLKKTENPDERDRGVMLGRVVGGGGGGGGGKGKDGDSNQQRVRKRRKDRSFELYQVRGKKNIRIRLIEPTIKSLNREDVFIVETKMVIYIWCGANSNRIERGVGLDFANKLKQQKHMGRPKLVTLVDGENDLAEGIDSETKKKLRNKNFSKDIDQKHAKPFWKLFKGAKKSQVSEKNKSKMGKVEFENWWIDQITLYQFQLDGELVEICKGFVEGREVLDTTSVFVLVSSSGVFLWIGKKVKWALRQKSRQATEQLTKRFKLTKWNPIKRNFENGEDPLFKLHFISWPDSLMIAVSAPRFRGNKAKANSQQIFDLAKMLTEEPPKETVLPNDGSGKKTIWWVDQNNKHLLPENYYGHFCQNQSYVIHYRYVPEHGKEYNCIFFWQGRYASINEKGASALLTIETGNKELGGEAKQIRVPQGFESIFFHFTFNNSMIMHFGNKEKWDGKTVPFDAPALYQIKSENNYPCRIEKRVKISYIKAPELKNDPYKCRAIQVPLRVGSINSFSCFVLISKDKIYLWKGERVSNVDYEHCKKDIIPRFLKIEKREVIQINENHESKQSGKFYDIFFTEMLKSDPNNDQWKKIIKQSSWKKKRALFNKNYFVLPKKLTLNEDSQGQSQIKLWECRYEKGIFDVEKIPVLQQLLKHDHCYILDVNWALFLWIGLLVNQKGEIAKKSIDTSIKYHLKIKKKFKNYRAFKIIGGHEPQEFVSYFWGWDDSINVNNPRIKIKKRKISVLQDIEVLGENGSKNKKNVSKKYTFQQLTGKNPPDEVDRTRLEDYLLDEEFQKILKMSKQEFERLPQWKKRQKKKQSNLF
ncbi:villin [Anaeramoeba flamelloides]|uniref:Villin n=1 Tax=Anaeramoeba flamelloides TaxID=1746091 RepID=A0AAV7Y1A7_9EUKA|nr:villin [Anaeramoeba flamelloides]